MKAAAAAAPSDGKKGRAAPTPDVFVPQDVFFKQGEYTGKYSEYDAQVSTELTQHHLLPSRCCTLLSFANQGVPTHDAAGEELSIKARKRLVKKCVGHLSCFCAVSRFIDCPP